MHDWSRTDLTWQRNWKEKRGAMSGLDRGPVPSSRSRLSLGAGRAAPAPSAGTQGRRHSALPGEEAPSWQKATSGHHSQLIPSVLSPIVPPDPPGQGKDFTSSSSQVLLLCSLHPSCMSAWSLLKGDTRQGCSIEFMKDLWMLWEKRHYTATTQCHAAAMTLHSMQQKPKQEFFC